MTSELNDLQHAISTCRYNSAVGIEMIDNITQTEHRFDSTASVKKFGMYNIPVDLLYILNVILLYALRIVDHNPVISLKSSYLSCTQERRKFE